MLFPPVIPARILAQIRDVIESNKGIFLDIGCSDHKSPGSVGMDKRAVAGVDIVQDIEVMPWPLPDACCARILMSHIIEHLDPSKIMDIFEELHRILRPNGQLLIAMPYAGSPRFWQDPTHRHAWIEATPQYFDCDYPLWQVYRPSCWKVEQNFWNQVGDLNVVMAKRLEDHGPYHQTPKAGAV
jgi:predicted SAM-dependent methyltransferase